MWIFLLHLWWSFRSWECSMHNKQSKGFLWVLPLPSFTSWHHNMSKLHSYSNHLFRRYPWKQPSHLTSRQLRTIPWRQGRGDQNQPVLGSRTTAMILELEASVEALCWFGCFFVNSMSKNVMYIYICVYIYGYVCVCVVRSRVNHNYIYIYIWRVLRVCFIQSKLWKPSGMPSQSASKSRKTRNRQKILTDHWSSIYPMP